MTGSALAVTAGAGAIQRLRPSRDAEYRLFLFHHAGGSSSFYRTWQHSFPTNWDVCTVNVPGRGRLSNVPAMSDWQGLLDYLLPELAQWCDGPFGFFGHSMGGIVAYELTGELLRRGRRAPSWLGVSACVPPAIQARSGESPPKPGADDAVVGDRLRNWLAESGHTPDQLLADRKIWEMFGPVFQADFRLVDNWRPDREQAALPVPMTAFGGSEDPLVRAEDLRLWGEQSQRFLGEHVYPGDHFYVGGHRRQVIRQIVLSVLWAHNEGK